MNEKKMKCELTDRDQCIDDFLLGKLTAKESEAFEIHLFGCRECFQELRLREQAVELIREERVTAVAEFAEHQSVVRKRTARMPAVGFFANWQRKWVFAGVAAVAMVVILFMQSGQKDSSPDLLAEQFQENPQFESLLQQNQRSTGYAISIQSPKVGEAFQKDIFFRAEIKKDGEAFTGALELKIMDNKGNVIYNKRANLNNFQPDKTLASGLYYWAILDERGEQLYLGKFFVLLSEK